MNFDKNDFVRIWGMTALFHDIGYPFQLAHEQIKTYVEDVLGTDADLNPHVSYENMNHVLYINNELIGEYQDIIRNNLVTEMFAYNISKHLNLNYDIILDDLNNRFRNKKQYMDHGYFSAVLLFDKVLKSKNKIDESIIDATTAILLHNNFYRYDLKKKIENLGKIDIKQHPLACLLILCDELQSWNREPFGYVSKKDPLAWGINLSVDNENINIAYLFNSEYIEVPLVSSNTNEINITSKKYNKNILKIIGRKFKEGIQDLELLPVSNSIKDDILNMISLDCNLHISYEIKEVKKREKRYASTEKFINLCDFAKAIHESYRLLQKQKNIDVEAFENLPLEYKLSNIEQAKSYSEKLELINCFYSDKELDYQVINGFVDKEVETNRNDIRKDLGFLAREEHIRWVKEKISQGWTYGIDYITVENGVVYENRKMRDKLKIHKDIIPYDLLTEEEKEKDKILIKNMVPLLYEYGHGLRIYSYREGRKPVLNIAGCGHRTIKMDNEQIKNQIKEILQGYMKDYRVVVRTNFAFGADQIIAQCANELGITHKAAIPLPYEEYIQQIKLDSIRMGYKFTKEDEKNMRNLLAQAASFKVIEDKEFTYLAASKYIINKCDKLIALWDGIETKLVDNNNNLINQGGTYHNIRMAIDSRGLNKDRDIHIIKCNR